MLNVVKTGLDQEVLVRLQQQPEKVCPGDHMPILPTAYRMVAENASEESRVEAGNLLGLYLQAKTTLVAAEKPEAKYFISMLNNYGREFVAAGIGTQDQHQQLEDGGHLNKHGKPLGRLANN